MSRRNTQKRNDIDILAARENRRRFKLVPQDDEFVYQPLKQNFSFYQFCRMHNPDRSKRIKLERGIKVKVHEMRKLVYDEEYNLLKESTALITSDKLQNFIKVTQDHKYTLYETYEIESIDYPSDLELYTANSQILNGSTYLEGYSADSY